MDEMSIVDILKILRKKVWFIAAVTLLCAVTAFVLTQTMVKPTYSASATLLVGSGQEELSNTNSKSGVANTGSINAAERLVNSYIEILKSDVAIKEVQKKINDGLSIGQIKSMLNLQAIMDTQVLTLTATSGDPDAAVKVVNALQEVAPSMLEDVMKVGVARELDTASSAKRVGPNIRNNTLLGVLLGLVISILIVLLRSMLDRTVKGEEDVKEHYDVIILGSVPEFSESQRGGEY